MDWEIEFPFEGSAYRPLVRAGTLSTSRSRWGVSRHTVRDYSTNLRRKLDVRSSLGAVMAAVRLGVLTFDDAGYVHGES